MRENEFREWLSRRTYQGIPLTAKGVNNRVRKAPRIERALPELGFSERDLDAVHLNRRWADLVQAVSKVAADWHSNEPAARKMAPEAPDPTRQLSNLINVARQYGHFASGDDPNYDAEVDDVPAEEIDEAALEELKARFLAQYPDFESGGGFPGQSSYHTEEDDYKRALIEKARPLIATQDRGLTALGRSLLDLVLDDEINLVGDYRRKNHLRAVRDRSAAQFEEAVGALTVSSEPPPQAATEFVDVVWPLVLEGSEHSQPYADIRVLATLFQAIARPKTAIAVSYTRFHNLGVALLGRSLFGNNPLTADEYEDVLSLSAELFTFMEEWGWHPRDLWDVQGFIWVTCKEKLELDARSDADRIRRYALETYIIPARQRGDTSVTIRCGDVHNALGMTAAHANVCQSLRGRKFQEMAGVDVPTYAGPDNSSTTTFTYAFDRSEAAAGQVSRGQHEPTNLILYGPPGTGKTFATTAEAVRLCDGLDPDDPLLRDATMRAELRRRYNQLVEAGQVRLVTFHQNYSYEEFVEGLRPVTDSSTENEEGTQQVGFRLEPKRGIFREICSVAENARKNAGRSGSFDLAGRKLFKMSLGRLGVEDHWRRTRRHLRKALMERRHVRWSVAYPPSIRSINDRIVRHFPLLLWVIHHNVDENRQKPAQHSGSVLNLVPVSGAVPGGSAMDQLVS